jgi:hypothetical protein
MITPRSPAEDDKIHDTDDETSVRPTEDPSKPQNAKTQAGSSAVSPRSQYPVDGIRRRPKRTTPAPEPKTPKRPATTDHVITLPYTVVIGGGRNALQDKTDVARRQTSSVSFDQNFATILLESREQMLCQGAPESRTR